MDWITVKEYEDITYKMQWGRQNSIQQTWCSQCFSSKTTSELYSAFYDAQEDTSIGVVLLSAEGPSSKDGVYSFVVVEIKCTWSSGLCRMVNIVWIY
jgi:naphthoate synthase